MSRAFRLLDGFIGRPGAASLAELTESTGLPKATVFRIVSQLVSLGILEKQGEAYVPGGHLFTLGSLMTERNRLREMAKPFMADLYEVTRETVHLGVMDGSQVLYLEKLMGHRGTASTRVGTHKPAYCTALGKALLAHAEPHVVKDVLRAGLVRHTPYTSRGPEQTMMSLRRVAESGLAYDKEEYSLGVSCVAAAVTDQRGRAIAALSISGATHSFKVERFGAAVRTAAMGLSRRLAERGGVGTWTTPGGPSPA